MLFENFFLYETKNLNPPCKLNGRSLILVNVKKKSLRYILRAIVMLFLRAKVIPVNPQIHGNVMRPLCVLNFIFEPLFVHALDITVFFKFLLRIHSLIKYVYIVNAELIENTLKKKQ